MNKEVMPDSLRSELAGTIRRLLPTTCDVEAIAREMDALGPAIGGGTWTRPDAVDARTRTELLRTALRATPYRPDLTLLTDNEAGQVYMCRWWLDRESVKGERGQYGLYVHAFENDDPQGLHNHPWTSASLMLAGYTVDHNALYRQTQNEATLLMRPAAYKHRVTLAREGPQYLQKMIEDETGLRGTAKAITLIGTGRRTSSGWGFEKPDGSIERADTEATPQGATQRRP